MRLRPYRPDQVDRGRLDALRDRLTVSAVVGRAVALKKAGGSEFTGLCPFHDERTPSFTVNDKKQFWHCFGCGAHGDVIGFVMRHEGLSFKEAIERLEADAGTAPLRPPPPRPPQVRPAGPDDDHRRWAAEVFRAASPLRAADAGDLYLRRRGLEPLGEAWPADLRLHPALPHPNARQLKFVTLVAAVRDAAGGLMTLHRVFLEQRAGAWDRLRNDLAPRAVGGSFRGGAIRLGPAAPVMGLAEGIETSLAAALLYRVPFWAAVSSGNMRNVALPPDCARLLIGADRDTARPEKGYPDGVGQHWAIEAARVHRAPGRDVRVVRPNLPAPSDFNDVLLARRAAGLATALATGVGR